MVTFVVKLNKCWIGTKIGVVVDIDTPIMLVVCGKFFGKNCGEIEKLLDYKKNLQPPDSRTRGPAAPAVLVVNNCRTKVYSRGLID